MPARIRTLALGRRVLSVFLLACASAFALPAMADGTSAALQDTTCAGQRDGSALLCTAGEFTVDAVVQEATGTLPTCTIGGTAEIDIKVHLLGSNTDRNDAAFFVGQAGNDPKQTTGTCSVATFPTSPAPFKDNDGDACGDYAGNGNSNLDITGIKVACVFGTDPAVPATYGKLLLPYTLTYWQNNGNVCTGADVATSGSKSKCNSGVGSISGVTLTGFVDITKQTVPDGDPTVFNFATTGTAPIDTATDANFTLSDGQTHRVETLVNTTTQTITITEASTAGWNDTATITCLDYLGNPTTGFVTTNGAQRTFTATLSIAHPAVACTITNVKGIPLTLNKTWVNGKVSDAVTLTTTGAPTNVNFPSVSDTGNETDTATPVIVTSGNVITLAENFTTGSAANYNTSLACTGNANPLVGNVLTVSATDTALNCTFTNSRKSAQLTARKAWSNAVVNDAVTITTTGGASNVNFTPVANTPSETDTDASPITVFAGEQLTFDEQFTTGLPGDYATSLACTGTNGLSGNVLTIGGADTAITCTYTNARTPVSLTIRKQWQNAIIGDAVTVSTVGGINSAQLPSTVAAPNQLDTAATPIQVFAGENITIGEVFNTGSAANYNASLACTGNATPLAGATLTVTAGDTAIVCTETNSRLSANLVVRKTWVNAITGNAVTVTGSGGINTATLPSVADSANETDASGNVAVFVGEQITLGEAFTSGSAANYSSDLACAGNNTVLAGNVLTVNAADTTITCTFTNTRASGSLTLAKNWINAAVNDAVTVSGTGGATPATLDSVANAATETDLGSPVTISTGDVITISENFTVGSPANYASSLNCTGMGTGTSLVGNVLTVGATPGTVTCTETNARGAGTLAVAKTWVNAAVGNAVTVNATGGANTATVGSVAGSANETDAGTPVAVAAGEVFTIVENFTSGSAANYTSGLACTGLGNGTTLVGNVLTIGPSPGSIVCTETNTRTAGTLAVAKTWVNAHLTDAVTVSATGGANPATVAAVADSASETDLGTPVAVSAGEVYTIGETFSSGSAANYNASLACTGLGEGDTLVGNVLTLGSSPGAIVCTETNARRSATMTLRKTWTNATVNDAVTVSANSNEGGSASLPAVADTGNETDTGTPFTVYAGEVATFSESFTVGAAGNYAASLACTGNANALAGNALTISPNDQALVCGFTNNRVATTLTLRKTWVNATVGDAVTVTGAGGANPASLASVANTANETDTGNPVAVLVGNAITLGEAFTTGSQANYTSALACTGNSTPLAGNVLTVARGDGAIVCTETNTRILRPLLNVTKTASLAEFIPGQPAAYTITVTNGGETATSGNITIADPLANGIALVSAVGTGWSCAGTTTLSCTYAGTLGVGASTTLTLNVSVASSALTADNTATASGGGDATCPAAAHCVGTVQVPIDPPGPSLSIVKSANPVRVNAGSLVLYTLQVTNIVNYNVTNAQIRDMPPNGLAYVPGSGTIYDANPANNAVSGARPIVFDGVDVAVGQTIRVQYLLRAGAALAAGEYVNHAQAFQNEQPISNIATFTVYAETGADPLLEQTRVLGKVFDDRNGDGWQDPGERGIPGVRIASVEGLVSETDAYGRYHQEGIVLHNQERGMNYVLKLDRATLPPGSTLTTENPLLRRITAAIPARFDFGVKLPPMPAASTRQEDLALGEINFTPGSTEIRPEYMGVLDRMAGEIHAHQAGEVFIDSATGNSPLAFERAGKVRDELITRLSPEERNAFTITVRLQAADGTTGTVGLTDEVMLGQVFFDTDKSTIRPEFEALLDKIAASIESVGSGRVSIVGHADLRASTEYNLKLGMRRANSVYDAIAKRLSPEARTKLSVEVEGAVVAPGAGQ